jgi:transposase-like protein
VHRSCRSQFQTRRPGEALDAPSLDLRGPVEIDKFYVSAGLKGRERNRWSRPRGLSRRGRGTYEQDKSPVFVLVDRGTEQRYIVPAKSADESTIRLLLADRQQEPLPVYTTDFSRTIHLRKTRNSTVNTCESHASLARRWLSPHRGISKDRLTQYFRAFQHRRELYRKPGREALKHAVKVTL